MSGRLWTRGLGLARRAAADVGGGVVPMAAAGVPVVALLSIAATELASLSAEKGRMQDAADAVVLDAANQLSFSSPESVLARAEANALEQLSSMRPRTTLTAKAELIDDGKGIRLAVDGNRLSFFGNMLPPGGFKTHVHASAVTMNTAPLCIVALSDSEQTKLDHRSVVDAGECLVHANGDLKVDNEARLRAISIQVGGTAQGANITPAALTGAAPINDPFGQVTLPTQPGCLDTDRDIHDAGTVSLAPGRHCGHLDIEDTAVVLLPGVHVFNGEIQLKEGASLRGDDVTVVFDEGAKFKIDHAGVRIALTGAKDGEESGFVFVGGDNRAGNIELPARQIEKLEGVVYSRNARVIIGRFAPDGSKTEEVEEDVSSLLPTMAESSKWTVIVARELHVRDDASMVVNADYLSSNVPVPAGVGNRVGRNIRLAR